MVAFQFYLELGKERKAAGGQVRRVGWLEETVILFLVKNPLMKEEM
jgi:hypothetical protein